MIDRFPWSHHRPSIIKVPSLVQPIDGKPVKRWNFRKANWELFTSETEKKNTRSPKIHTPVTRTPHTQRIATCLYALRRRASHAASKKTTSPDGTIAATTSFASTSRPPPRKTSTQLKQHYSRSWMKYARPGGLRLWNLWTSHIQVARRCRP